MNKIFSSHPFVDSCLFCFVLFLTNYLLKVFSFFSSVQVFYKPCIKIQKGNKFGKFITYEHLSDLGHSFVVSLSLPSTLLISTHFTVMMSVSIVSVRFTYLFLALPSMSLLLVPSSSDRIHNLNEMGKSTELLFQLEYEWLVHCYSRSSFLVGRTSSAVWMMLFWGLSLESHCWLICKSSRKAAYYLYTLYCQKPA